MQQGGKGFTTSKHGYFMPGTEQKAPGIRDRLGCQAPLGVYQPAFECKYLEFMLLYPTESAWMLLASLPKFHFHPAILRGFWRPFVSSCHSLCKLPIWPWQRTGRSNPVILTAWLWLFSETFASVQVAFLCLIS